MARGNGIPTLTGEELKRALAAEDTPRRDKVTDDEKHEYAVAILHTMRGLTKRDKGSVLRRAARLLAAN